jgi:hypothetical protein
MSTDANTALECLHLVDMDSVADVSEVHAATIFYPEYPRLELAPTFTHGESLRSVKVKLSL